MMPSFGYVRPKTLDDAIRLLGSPGSRAMAGGTDLHGCLRDRVMAVDRVVSLRDVPGLGGIEPRHDGTVRVGAMTTLADLASNALVAERYPTLAQAAAAVGSPQLRNQGTLGGNLCQKPRCWYYRGDFLCLRKGGEMCFAAEGENQGHALFGAERCFYVHPSDTAPALVALGASARLVGPSGTRALPLERFFVAPSTDPRRETALGPGEILTEVVLPPPGAGLRSSYRKVRARAVWDFALAGVALAVRVEAGVVREARVVLSGVAPVPWRHTGAEAALVGKPLDAPTISAVAAAATTGAEPLAQNGYKVELLRGLLTDELERMARG